MREDTDWVHLWIFPDIGKINQTHGYRERAVSPLFEDEYKGVGLRIYPTFHQPDGNGNSYCRRRAWAGGEFEEALPNEGYSTSIKASRLYHSGKGCQRERPRTSAPIQHKMSTAVESSGASTRAMDASAGELL